MKTTIGLIAGVATVEILGHGSRLCQAFTGNRNRRRNHNRNRNCNCNCNCNHPSMRVVPGTGPPQRRRMAPLSLANVNDSSNSYSNDPAFRDWSSESRIDVRNLLTQRAIQSFMFLCEECRDPHSGKWIEDFFGTPNLLNYHGTGASLGSVADSEADGPSSSSSSSSSSWETPLLSILDQPTDVMIVSAKRRGRGHGGWSKNNPYLKDRYVEFKITIDPSSLTERILAVREQLAEEWVNDLQILGRANQQILDSYFRLARDERSHGGSASASSSPSVAFERTAVNALNAYTGFGASGSPFRKGNFDLLYNLCTQASIHRLLSSTLREQGDEANHELLRRFYVERLDEFFDGDLPFGRADDFIEELLLLSPTILPREGEGGRVALTDPFGLSEKIIEARNDICLEWIEAMKLVPTAHQEGVRKNLLDKRMEAWNAYSAGKSGGSGASDNDNGSDNDNNDSGGFQ